MRAVKSRVQYQLAAKEMRDGKRYKQVEIARGSGLSQPMVSRLISSESLENFTVGSIVLMADWLGCSIDDLIQRDHADDEQ